MKQSVGTFTGIFLWERVNCNNINSVAQAKKETGKFETIYCYMSYLKCIDFSSLRTLSKYFFQYLKMNQYYCQN